MNPSPNPPNEPPKTIWRRPWSGPAKVLGWLGILTAAVFVIVFSLGFVEGGDQNLPELLLFSLLFAVILSVVVAGAIWVVRWLCSWRNLRRALFGLACLITLVALAYAVENWRGRRAWLAHRAAWESKGEKFTIAALAPPPVPDEKNFALTPFLKPAMDFSHGSNGLVWRDTNGLARLQRTRMDLAPGRSTNDQMVLGSLEKGTFADLAAGQEFYRGNTNYPQPTTVGTPAEDIAFALAKFDPEFSELRAATLSRPLTRYPIEYDSEPSWGILLPHLAQIKGLTQLAHVRATAALAAGRSDAAFADLNVGFRLSDGIRDEPILIDHLVRIACLAIDLQTVREGLLRHAWTDAQLVELQTYLRSLNVLAEYRFAMRGERAFGTSGLDFLRRQGFRNNPFDYLGEEGGRSTSGVGFNLMPSGWFYQNMLTGSQIMQDHLLLAVDEQAHRAYPEVSERGARAIENMRRGPYTVFAKLLLPALEKTVRKSARMQTFVDEAVVACALERYRLANGKLPAQLAELTPRYLEAIPTDVIDGKPLRYRLDADGGYALWSIGWNQRDEGGELAWNTGKNPGVDVGRGDWVWLMPAK